MTVSSDSRGRLLPAAVGKLIVRPIRMMTTVSQWPYLVEIDGVISLQPPDIAGADSRLGDVCGEWGSHLDEKRQPGGCQTDVLAR
jgi:hypothetical protein